MLSDKLYTNYFFIRIDLDWLEHAKDGKYLVFKVIFLSQKSAEIVYFFLIEEYKVSKGTFLSDTFWLFSFLKPFIFWNRAQFLARSNQSKSISMKK